MMSAERGGVCQILTKESLREVGTDKGAAFISEWPLMRAHNCLCCVLLNRSLTWFDNMEQSNNCSPTKKSVGLSPHGLNEPYHKKI